MSSASADGLRERAHVIATSVGGSAEVIATKATVGGGSLPGEILPSFGVAIGGRAADRTLAALRRGNPSVVGRIEAGRVVLDLRTVEPDRDGALASAVIAAIG